MEENAYMAETLYLEYLKLDRDRLQVLYDYTKFHIGMYATLMAALVSASQYLPEKSPTFLRWTLLSLLLAGGAGGVVASNIPEFYGYAGFIDASIGFIGIGVMRARYWIHLEHFFFWVGVAWAVLNAFTGPKSEKWVGLAPKSVKSTAGLAPKSAENTSDAKVET